MTNEQALNNCRKEIEDILRSNEDELLFEYCDCGCPNQRVANSKASAKIIRLLEAIRQIEEE